jgi:DNA-binding transcriptional MocR family regulator
MNKGAEAKLAKSLSSRTVFELNDETGKYEEKPVPLNAAAQAVLLQLMAHTQGKGFTTCVGQTKIAKNTGLSVRTVERAISTLKRAGVISPKGFSYEFGVRKWGINLPATSDGGPDKTSNLPANCDGIPVTSDGQSKRTKKTNRAVALAYGGKPQRDEEEGEPIRFDAWLKANNYGSMSEAIKAVKDA